MRTTTLTFFAASILCAACHGQTTIVQWGEAGGAQDIVTGNVPLDPFPTTTYSANLDNNPDIGANYYPNATDRTPTFSAAGAHDGDNFLFARQIQQNVNNGDRIRLEATAAGGGGNDVQGMLVFDDENWLPTIDDTLSTLTVEAFRSNPEPEMTAGSGRFLIENADGWYASDSLALQFNFLNHTENVADLDWFDFTPMDAGVVTIGDAATPVFTGVESVGYYFQVTTPSVNPVSIGAFIRHFQATTAAASDCINSIAGDYDCNGNVSASDLNLVLNNWGQSATPVPDGWINDLPEGTISAEELNGVLNNWGNTVPLTVPEPTGIAWIAAIVGAALLRRR